MSHHCAFLTMEKLDGYVSYDARAVPPLEALGWTVEFVPWRKPDVHWSRYEVVVIRTTWDYHEDPEGFLRTLRGIHDSGARLENSLDLVEWNLHKSYLRNLARRGIPVVPTRWVGPGQLDAELPFDELQASEVIVKPAVGANASDTFRLSRGAVLEEDIMTAFERREAMIQPFLSAVLDEGEYSLFYFDGAFSHAIIKKPRRGDFRVQEEHGGLICAARPDGQLRATADTVLACLPETPLYARVDLIRAPRGDFVLIELELIEPSLYFDYDEGSPERFARALHERMTR